MTDHNSLRQTYSEIDFSLFKGAGKHDVLPLPATPIRIPRSDNCDRTVPVADPPHLWPKDPLTRESQPPPGFPSIGSFDSSWSQDMTRWLRNTKALRKGSKEREPANFATSGCFYCWTCGETLENMIPACKPAKSRFIRKLMKQEDRCMLRDYYRTVLWMEGPFRPFINIYPVANLRSITLTRGKGETRSLMRRSGMKSKS